MHKQLSIAHMGQTYHALVLIPFDRVVKKLTAGEHTPHFDISGSEQCSLLVAKYVDGTLEYAKELSGFDTATIRGHSSNQNSLSSSLVIWHRHWSKLTCAKLVASAASVRQATSASVSPSTVDFFFDFPSGA